MGAGNSSQGKVIQSGRASDPSHKDQRGFKQVPSSQPAGDKLKLPEVNIRTITWTRESHGLFDFEVKESERKLFEKKQFKIKGHHRLYRSESDVYTELSYNENFENLEKKMSSEATDKIIARLMHQNGSYWIFHRNYIDEMIDQVLEKKPEEKIWRVVRDNRCAGMEMPCYRLQKKDLIKVGRVRFKIRDIMSPVYREIESGVDVRHEHHREMFPSMLNDSISSSIIHPDGHESDEGADANGQANAAELNGDAAEIAEAHSVALLTESDEEEGEEPELQHANTILQGDVRGVINDAGMNAEELHSDREDQNNTHQFDTGKNMPKKAAQLQKSLKAEKANASKKDLDNLESASRAGQSELPVCRICLMEESEVDNPLFAPCKCSGSMRFIHHQCLKTWFGNKRIMKVSNIVTTYFWKNLECELCKTAYPYETRSLDGKKMLNIIEYDTPQPEVDDVSGQVIEAQYIVLESISSNTSKVIHVVNMKETLQLYIGRGHDAHVRVTDISVSRLHATLIKSVQGYYFLTDNDSKFGTLSLVKTPLELPQGTSTTLQIGRSIFDIEVKNMSNFTLNGCLCFGSKPKTQIGAEQNLITLDGNVYFPSNFASQEFMDNMDKRRLKGLRRNSKKLKKSTSTQMGSTLVKASSAHPNVQAAAIPTENAQGDESQFGQDDEQRLLQGSARPQFAQARQQQNRQQNSQQQRQQQQNNNINRRRNEEAAEFDYGAEEEDDDEEDEEDDDDESDDYDPADPLDSEEPLIMPANQNQRDPQLQLTQQNNLHHHHQNSLQNRQQRQQQIEAEEEAQLAMAIQQSLAMQEEEQRMRQGAAAVNTNAASAGAEEEKEGDAKLDAEIDQLDKELSGQFPVEESKDGGGVAARGNNNVAAPTDNSRQYEEHKSPDTKKVSNATGRADDVSNISTQRASQVMNRFTSQVSHKNTEEIKEDIAQVPQSPISAEPLILQSETVDLGPNVVDFNATSAAANLIPAPQTQLIQGQKAQNLIRGSGAGKHTERVSDKSTVVQNGVNQATIEIAEESNSNTAIKIGEDDQGSQRRDLEERKIGRIREEQESENENDQIRSTAQKPQTQRQENAQEEQDDPEKNLPASATEVQPPELSGIASNNDNMETIQQREDDDQVARGSGVGQAAASGEQEEDKNNEE